MASRILFVITVALAAYLAYSFFQVFERVEEKTDLGWRAEARKNPYLAVQLLTEDNGHSLDVFDSAQKIDGLNQYDFIYLADSKLLLSEPRLEAILKWVEAGGHLMVSASADSDTYADKLLDALSVSVEDTEYATDFFDIFDEPEGDAEGASEEQASGDSGEQVADQDAPEDDNTEDEDDPKKIAQRFADELRRYNETLQDQVPAAETSDALPSVAETIADYDDALDAEYITRMRFDDHDYELKAELNIRTQLDHPALYEEQWQDSGQRVIYWAGTDYGVHFLQIELGSGLVSVTTDSAIFDSAAVGYLDHAHLWQVLSGDRSAIVYGSNMPGLFTIIWWAMPELSIALLVLLFFKLWQIAGHFGPQKAEIVLARRSFHEHLLASAGFLWRNRWQLKLLAPLREEIMTMASARITGFHAASSDEQITLLAEQSQIPPAVIHDALTSDKPLNEDSFTKLVQVLQELRRSL